MKSKSVGTIYALVNVLNGMHYIGQTTEKPGHRYKKHLSSARTGSLMRIHMAIKQHGEQNFELRILQSEVPLDILNYTEAYYIQKFDSVRNGYNTDDGAHASHRERVLSAEHRVFVNERNIKWHKNNPEKSKAIIEKMNAVRLAKGVSEESRKKISESQKGNTNRKKGTKPAPISTEALIKMSKLKKGMKRTESEKQAMRAGWAKRKAQIAALKLPVKIQFN